MLFRYTLLLYGTAEDMTARPSGLQVTSSACVQRDTEGLCQGECPARHGLLAGSVRVRPGAGGRAGPAGLGLTLVSTSSVQNVTAPPTSWATFASPAARPGTSIAPAGQ